MSHVEEAVDWNTVPSLTRNPMSLQSIVVTGGGGKPIVAVVCGRCRETVYLEKEQGARFITCVSGRARYEVLYLFCAGPEKDRRGADRERCWYLAARLQGSGLPTSDCSGNEPT